MVAEGGEGENPLPFSLTAGGWGRGGGKGRYPGFVSLQVPTSEAAVSADTHAFARLPRGGLRKIVICGARPLVGWAWIPPLSPVDFLQGFLLRLKPMGPGLKTLGCYHNSQSADLGGR